MELPARHALCTRRARAQAWVDDLAAAGVTSVDGTRGLDEALAVKDVSGVEQVTKAGHLTARVGRAVWLKAMERAIEAGAEHVTNASLAAQVAESLDNLKAAGVKVDTDSFDWLQAPVVQSGGAYGAVLTRAGARSSDARFSADVVIFSQALKYKSHAAFLARTYLVDPTPSQTRAYDALVRAHDALVEKLRPGTAVRDAHAAAVAVLIAAQLPEAAKLAKTFGSGFGLRASEKHLVISSKNAAVVEAGMVFNVCVGLSELPLTDAPRGGKAADAAMAKLKSYALLLANTVVVTASSTEVVTDKLPSDRAQIVYSLADEEEDDDDDDEEEEEAGDDAGDRAAARAKAKAKAAAAAAAAPARSTRLAARKQEVDENMEAAARREEHQKELFAAKKAAAL
jgi:nucleosome binding factor SPN SPT16 subunit